MHRPAYILLMASLLLRRWLTDPDEPKFVSEVEDEDLLDELVEGPLE